jgi:hypothetical protein
MDMPWSPKDASKHTKAADTTKLKELWADVANRALMEHDEGAAIRIANAAVKKAIRRRKRKGRR